MTGNEFKYAIIALAIAVLLLAFLIVWCAGVNTLVMVLM